MATLRLDALGLTANALLRIAVGAGGKDAVLVGGAVRDAVLGRVRRDGVDLDLAVPRGALALARRVAERGRGRLVPLDDQRGTARIVLGAGRIDVADFRALTLEGDLAARDFTVNALAVTAQPTPHRFPVLEHSLRAVDGADQVVARPGDLVPFGEELGPHLAAPVAGGVTRGQALKLAALLHDVSKPETRRAIGGPVRFFEHDLIGAERVRDIGERLRFPAAVTG